MEDNPTNNEPGPANDAAAATEVAPSELQRQRDEYYDRLLRKTAEFDNYRKRTERERQALAAAEWQELDPILRLGRAAAANVIEELLPLMDNLDRALKAEAGLEGAEAYRRGVELIHEQLGTILHKRGVRAIEAVGADFDPYYHQAVSHEPAEGRREGEVIEEFRRGYMLGDRLLRPSMVKVAKG